MHSANQRCQKCGYIFKVTPNGRAEIQNDGKCCFGILLILARTLLKCKHTFGILGHLVKKNNPQIFER